MARKSRKVKVPKLNSAKEKKKRRLAREKRARKSESLKLGRRMRGLPLELSDMIFRDALYSGPSTNYRRINTPPLVVALRGTEFYIQILKLWYDGTYMRWGEGAGPNPYNIGDITPATLLMVKKLRVKVERPHINRRFLPKLHKQKNNLYPNLCSQNGTFEEILLAENLRELALNLTQLDRFMVNDGNIVETWLDHFKALKKLTLLGVSVGFEWLGVALINSALQNVQVFEKKKEEKIDGYGDYGRPGREHVVFWEAGKGKFLCWKTVVIDGSEGKL